MKMHKVLLTAVAVSLLLAPGVACAGMIPIYLDFGNVDPDPTLPAGATWNTLVDKAFGTSIADLVDSAGDSTGIGVSVTTAFNHEGYLGGDWGGTPIWGVNGATSDNFSTSNSTGKITFTGLTAGGYDFSVISSRAVAPDDGIRSGTFLINAVAPDNHVGTFSASQDGWINRTVMTWTGVNPLSGQIVLSVSSASGQFGYLSALSFYAVPEPTTLALAAPMGLFGLLAFTRRRRKHRFRLNPEPAADAG